MLAPLDAEPETTSSPVAWKILMVDDDEDIHRVTMVVLRKVTFRDRPVAFLSAYSSAEARELLVEHADIAVILLDVVMETEYAGLDLVRYIRQELGNHLTRIILRTGNPGTVPERDVILTYDINDYREKTDLTATRLFTSVVAALRAYADMSALEQNRRRMQCLAMTAARLHSASSHEAICRLALGRVLEMWNLCAHQKTPHRGFAARRQGQGQGFVVLAGEGDWHHTVGQTVEEAIPPEDGRAALAVVGESLPRVSGTSFALWHRIPDVAEFLIYLRVEEKNGLPLDEEAFRVLANSIGSAFEHLTLYQEIKDTQGEVILTICEVVETRSKETGNHVRRVGELAALLAGLLGLPAAEVELLRLSAPLHDLGKIAIPDHVLNKPGRFDVEETRIMQQHCQVGHRLLCGSRRDFLQDAAIIALQHHEKWDGSGYPAGLAGEAIHLHGRIVAVADVFDALGHARSYKEPWPLPRIVDYFREQRGLHFDPRLVDLLLNHLQAFEAIQEQFPG